MTLFYGHNLNIHIHTITQGKVFLYRKSLWGQSSRAVLGMVTQARRYSLGLLCVHQTQDQTTTLSSHQCCDVTGCWAVSEVAVSIAQCKSIMSSGKLDYNKTGRICSHFYNVFSLGEY